MCLHKEKSKAHEGFKNGGRKGGTRCLNEKITYHGMSILWV